LLVGFARQQKHGIKTQIKYCEAILVFYEGSLNGCDGSALVVRNRANVKDAAQKNKKSKQDEGC
jgi:hypothetical protein